MMNEHHWQVGSTLGAGARREYKQGLALLFVFLCAYSAVEIAVNLNRPYWGDEEHFIETVRQFSAGITFDTIAHYNEMSTPLPFILYGAWARLFGLGTQTIRAFSLVLASLTYIALYELVFSIIYVAKNSLLTTVFVALNPYMLAFSVFVYGDMAAMLFLILVCIAVKHDNPVLFLVSTAAALLSRQYLIFLPMTAGVYYLARLTWLHGKERLNAIWMLVAAAVSSLPLLILFGIWHGPNPDNVVQQLYVGENFRFHPNSLTLYIALLSLNLLPIVLLNLRSFTNPWGFLIALTVSWFYRLYPVQPSQVSVDVGVDTVGVFHRLIRNVLGSDHEQWIFFPLFLAGLTIALVLIKDVYLRWSRRDLNLPLFLGLSILFFLAIMPFSYLGWEKYFLPAVPITAIWILVKNESGPTALPVRIGSP